MNNILYANKTLKKSSLMNLVWMIKTLATKEETKQLEAKAELNAEQDKTVKLATFATNLFID